jgi:hypothetical protein
LSVPRNYLAAASIKDIVLFAGGFDGETALSIVEIYNLTSNEWTNATLSQARFMMGVATVRDVVLFAGIFFVL